MRQYSVVGPSEAGTANKTAVTIIGATTVRPEVVEVIASISTAPADQNVHVVSARFTAAGTAASNPTPKPLDPSDVASVATAGITHSAEPTYTASESLIDFYLHFRNTMRWVAQEGCGLKGPATAANGIGTRLVAASASATIRATVHFRE